MVSPRFFQQSAESEESEELKRSRTGLAIKANGPGPFLFEGQWYEHVQQKQNLLDINLICSAGSTGRELIFLDMQDQKLEDSLWEACKRFLIKEIGIDEAPTQVLDADAPKRSSSYIAKSVREEAKASASEFKINKHPSEYLIYLAKFVKVVLKPVKNEEEVENIVAKYVAKKNKPATNPNEKKKVDEKKKTDEKKKADEKKIPERVPLRCFLKVLKGYCRHSALALIYLLAKVHREASKNKVPDFNIKDNKIFHYRKTLYREILTEEYPEHNVHTVTIYETQDHRYFIDATRNLVVDIANPETNRRLLEKVYRDHKIIEFVTEINDTYNPKLKDELKLQTEVEAKADAQQKPKPVVDDCARKRKADVLKSSDEKEEAESGYAIKRCNAGKF